MANRFMGQSSFFASIANGALSQILQQRTEEREYGRQKEMADTRAKQNESFQQQQHALALERQNAAREGQDSEVDKLRKRHEWIMSLPEDQRKYYLGEGGGAKSYNYRSVVEKFFRNKEQDGRKVDPAHIDNVIFRLEQLGKEPTETMIDTVNKSIGDTKYAQLSLSEKSEKVDDMIWTWYNNPGIDPRSNGLQINQDARGNLSVAPEDRKMIMDMMFPGEDNAPTARSGEPGAVPGADNIVGPPAPVADEKPEPSPFETRDRKRLFSHIGSLNKLTQDQMDEHVYDYREVNEVISKVVSPDATMKPDEGDPERVSISQMVNDLMKSGVPPSLINDTVKMVVNPDEEQRGLIGSIFGEVAGGLETGKKIAGIAKAGQGLDTLGNVQNVLSNEIGKGGLLRRAGNLGLSAVDANAKARTQDKGRRIRP